MKRLLMVCALAGLAMACGDDDGGDKPPVKPATDGGGIDSGTPDSGVKPDAGPVVVKVTNPGAACSAAAMCTGAAPTCDTATQRGQANPGGYCSAQCLKNEECGPTGDCPVGEIIGLVGAATAGQTTGTCLLKCTPGAASGCRDGYVCASLAQALGMPASLPPLSRTVCLPAPAPGDGGVGDAGTVARLDGGLDAGR